MTNARVLFRQSRLGFEDPAAVRLLRQPEIKRFGVIGRWPRFSGRAKREQPRTQNQIVQRDVVRIQNQRPCHKGTRQGGTAFGQQNTNVGTLREDRCNQIERTGAKAGQLPK